MFRTGPGPPVFGGEGNPGPMRRRDRGQRGGPWNELIAAVLGAGLFPLSRVGWEGCERSFSDGMEDKAGGGGGERMEGKGGQ